MPRPIDPPPVDPVRLLSPTRRRLITLDGNRPKDAQTMGCLARTGWTKYDGPGTADARGWYLGDDPDLDPPVPYGARGARG